VPGWGRAGDAFLIAKIEEILAQFFIADLIGRFAIVQRQMLDGLEIGALGVGRETTQLHVLDHALA